ncbi:MAG: hypothetical protein DMG40_09630 [Acidobacteria bacterium]|nr:MAG: hypothetical protein DMG40_09630 [Acidobacteriota bacterium]
MKLQSLFVRTSLLTSVAILTSCYIVLRARAQQESDAGSPSAASKFPAAKWRARESNPVTDASADTKKAPKAEKETANSIRRREKWFYRPRASANGHIPAGARMRALQHMQRMMIAEGKLVQRPDGSLAEVAPQFAAAPLVSPVTNTWSSIGPTPTTGGFFSPVTGRITAIAVDPSDTTGNTVLIGGAQGGIWRTMDGGTTWAAVGDQNASLAMGSIAFAPSACSAAPGSCTVYAATGEQASIGFDIYYGAGVLVSTDHGQTWKQTCATASSTCPFIGPYSDLSPFGYFTLGGTRISYVAVNPSNPQMVLVAAQTQFGHGSTEGVYCSADGGSTWNIVPTASGDMATFVGFASSSVAFAALGTPFTGATVNGVYKSTNATSCSLTFSLLSGGLPTTNVGRIDLGISPLFATDNTVYASVADASSGSSTNLGVFVTTNGGTSWTKTTAPDICQQQCWYDNVVKVDPNGGANAFFGGSAVLDPTGTNPGYVIRTTNGGTSWSTVVPNLPSGSPGFPHVDNHAIAFAKLSTGKIRMYLGNDGGIWRTDDAEAATLPLTWLNLNDSLLTLAQFYPALSVHPSSPAIAFAGAQDNGSQIYAGPSTTWTDNNTCGDGTGTAIDNVIPSTVYVACNGDNINVSVTNGAASSYIFAVNGINLADNSNFVPPMATDPGAANTAYMGTTKVYQTVNAGTSWTALSGDLVNGASPNFDSLTALGVAPMASASSVVYAGADTGQVFVATNVTAGTGTFNLVAGQSSLPSRQVQAIAVDGADSTGKTAYAALSGFSFVQGTVNDPKGHLFRTADGGATWQDVSCTVADCSTPGPSDLPNTPINDVVIDPDNPDTPGKTLYVATDIGVFQGTCVNATPTTCTWTTLSTGLPRVAVLSLKLHHASRTLMAATHGRGTWQIGLNNFTFAGPHISSISPVSASAGAATPLTLTVNGNGLTGGTAQWTVGTTTTPLNTTVVSDSQISATVPTNLLAGASVAQVSVMVATASNSLAFTVLGGPPTISSPVSPATAPVNSAATTITVNGTGFSASSKVLMNPDIGGTPIATTFVSATQLTATVPAAFMANFGSTNSVGVQNPPPGGGTTVDTSTVILPTFVVVAPAPANDNFANAVNITLTSGSFTDSKDSSGATAQTTDPVPACSQDPRIPFVTGTSNTIWYKFTPTSNGTITDVDTIGSSYDSVLSIWTGTAGSFAPYACNDDINLGIVTQSQIQNLAVTGGTSYYIMVSSFGQADPNPLAFGGESVLNFSFSATSGGGTVGTTTTVTPSSNSIASGGSVTLTAMVASTVTTGASPTGTVQFMNGTALLGSANCAAVSGASPPACTATLTTTLAFFALPTEPNHIPTTRIPWMLLASLALLLLLLLNLKRVPARYRRVYACAGVLLLAGLVVGLAIGCGSGGSSGPPPHTDSITGVYSGDSTYAGSTSGPVSITVQ